MASFLRNNQPANVPSNPSNAHQRTQNQHVRSTAIQATTNHTPTSASRTSSTPRVLNYRISLTDTGTLSLPGGVLKGEIIGDFNIHHVEGFIKPCTLVPKLNKALLQNYKGKRVEDVDAISHDPIRKIYANESGFHTPTLRSIREHSNPENILSNVEIIADRNSLRKIFKSCLPTSPDAFYMKRSDFSLSLSHSEEEILMLQGAQEERWVVERGGYGKGFENMIVRFNTTDRSLLAIAEDARYYRVQKVSVPEFGDLVVRFETDVIGEDNETIELKCKAEPKNPRHPISADFYRNIWAQMALSNTKTVIIAYHRGGNITCIESVSVEEMRRRAQISDLQRDQAFSCLFRFLKWIRENVPRGGTGCLSYKVASDHFELRTSERVDALSLDALTL